MQNPTLMKTKENNNEKFKDKYQAETKMKMNWRRTKKR